MRGVDEGKRGDQDPRPLEAEEGLRPFPPAALGAILVAATALAGDGAAAQRLLSYVEKGPATVSSAQSTRHSARTNARRFDVQVDFDLLRSAPEKLEVATPYGTTVHARLAEFQDRGGGDFLWSGHAVDENGDVAGLVVLTMVDSGIAGVFDEPGGTTLELHAVEADEAGEVLEPNWILDAFGLHDHDHDHDDHQCAIFTEPSPEMTDAGGVAATTAASQPFSLGSAQSTLPGVTLSVSPAQVTEDVASPVEVTVTAGISGTDRFSADQTLRIGVGGGTSASGTDYTAVPDFDLVIPAGDGDASATFDLHLVNDEIAEPHETIRIGGFLPGVNVTPAEIELQSDDRHRIDVVVLFTAFLRSRLPSIRTTMQRDTTLMFDYASRALQDAGAAAEYNVVHIGHAPLDLETALRSTRAIFALRDSRQAMRLRDEHDGDIIYLMGAGRGGIWDGGQAFWRHSAYPTIREYAWAGQNTTNYARAGRYRATAHELAHTLGGLHERGEAGQAVLLQTREPLAPYAYGYYNSQAEIRTILAYGTSRNPSSPAIYATARRTWNGHAIGAVDREEVDRLLKRTAPETAYLSDWITPGPPTGIGGTASANGGTASVALTWTDESSRETAQRIEYITSDRDPEERDEWTTAVTVGPDVTSVTITGLLPATRYGFRIRALNHLRSYPSETWWVTTPGSGPPTRPSSLEASAPADRTIRLEWQDNSTTENGFDAQYRTYGASAWTAGPGAAPDAVTVDVTGLLDDTEYEFRVGATNTQGTSWSDVVIAHTNVPTAPPPPPRPQAPAELLGARLTSTSVRLEWSDLSTNETGFAVEVRPDGGGPADWYVARTLPANVREAIVAGLPENAALEFRIAAIGAAASSRSDPLAIDLSVDPPPAAALTGRIKRVGQAIFADLRWTIDRKYKGEFRIWHKASTRPDWEIEPSWRSNRTRDARLTVPSYDRVLRTYRVETRSAGGRTFSNEIEIDFNNLPPAAVKKLTAAVAPGIPTEVRLSWKTARNATGYRVSYTLKGKTTVHAVYPSDATKAYVDGLEPGSYTFTVASLSRTGFSEAEKKLKLPKPASAPPKAAELLSVEHFGKRALQLRYKDRSTDETVFQSAIRADDGYWTYANVTTQDGPGDGGTSRGNWVVEEKTVYHLRVLAGSTNGSLNSNIITIYSSQDPGDVTVVPTGSTSVDVTWTDRANQETRFVVQYRGETGGWTNGATVKRNGTKASVDELVAGARYRFRVRARIPYSFGDDYWDDSDVVIVTMPPPGPSGVTATALDSTSATVQWTAASATETGFVIEARPAGDPNAEWSVHGTAGAGATTATAINLTPSATHEIRVLAVHQENGRSTPSDPVATVSMPPPPPSGLSATSTGADRVNLMWMDESTDETGFVAEYRIEGAVTWTTFGTEANANATRLTVTGLTGGGNFEFQVRARSANGLSSPSNTARVTGLGAPAAATGLTATATGPTTVDLAWADNSNDETGFDIEHRKNGLGAWTSAPGAATNDRAATVSGLAPSTVYEFRVNARNGSGAAPGVPVSVTMPPREPLQVAVQATDATSALVTWVDRTRDETGFRVERRTGGGAWSVTETTDPDVQRATLAGLATSTPYDVRVTAVSASGESPGNVLSLTMPPAAPTGLAATEASPTSVTLTWMESSPDEAGFIAEYRAARSGAAWTAWGTEAAANATTITVSGLTSGTGYEFRVLAKSNAGPNTPSDPVSIDPLGGPTAPTSVMATALGSNGASVSWRDNSSDETGFAVEWRLGADLWTTGATVGPNGTSAAIGHLFGSRSYEFRVTARNAVGASSSAPATLTLPPPAPTELSASPASRTSVTLTWTDNSADENNFVIEYLAASSLAVALATSTDTEGAPTSGGPEGMTAGQTAATWITFGTTAAADAETIAVTGLASDTPYAFRVSADHGTNGMSSPSNLVWLGSLGLPLAATGVTVQASGSTTVSVTWMDNSSDETGFAVQYRQPLGAWTTALTAGENARSATVSGLASSTAYEFRVNAMNENGSQPSAAVSLTMPPAAPTNLIAAPVSGTEVLLIWTDASTDETGFIVEYRESGQTSWTTFGSELPADTTRVTVTGLVAGKGYRFRVFANHGTNGLSSPSNVESTLGVPPPAAPTGVSVTAAGSTTAVVSWTDASANEQGFRVQYRTGSDPWTNGPTTGSNTASATVSGLTASTAYDFRVEAYNSTGTAPSSAVSLVMPPAAPTDLVASAASATSVTLSWTDNSSDETSFMAEYRAAGAANWTVFGTEAVAGATTLTVTGLVAGTAYEFRVYAKHGTNGLSSPSNVAAVAGLSFSSSAVNVTEGSSATYTVKLATRPTSAVTVTVSGHGSTDLSVDTDSTTPNDQTTLTFTDSTWNTAQTVTVNATTDSDSDNEAPITLSHAASGGGYNGVSGSVTVNIIDSDNPTVELSVSGGGAVTEGGTLTVTATVSRAPSGNLSVPVQRVAGNSTADASDYSLPALTIAAGATSGTATFTATNDAADEPAETLRLELGTVSGYDHGTSHQVDIAITDDDPTTVALSVPDATATEDSSSATATIRLTLGRGLVAGEALAVPLTLSGGTAGTDFTLGLAGSPAGVTFNAATGTVTFTGPSATVANVTLTASSDADAEGLTVTVSIPATFTGTNLDGGAAGSRSGAGQITITDDESKALTFSNSTVNVTEGNNATYTVRLTSRPTASVNVAITGQAGTDLTVGTPNLTFTTTNWNSARTVTVSASTDNDSDNEAPITLAHAASGGGYNGVSGNVTVNIIDSTAPVVLPTAPSGVSVAATGSTSVSVAWTDESSNETGFTLEHRTGAGAWTSGATADADAESAPVTDLLASTAYDFRVLAVNVHGSSPSGAVSLTMPPAAPTGLVASSATNTSATLTWRDASSDETSFVVQYRPAGSRGWTMFATEAAAGATSLTVTGLVAGTSYEFRVFAKHSANGLSSPSNVASVGTSAPPATPTGLAVEASGSTSVSVSWTDASTDETGFEVEYRTGSGPWATGATVEAGVTAATVTGLSPATAYDFRVASVNANGRSPSFPQSLTMPPAAASDLDGTATDATSVTLSWTVNSTGETGFQVEYRPARTEEWTTFATEFPAGTTTAVVTGLAAGTSHDFRVYAKHGTNGLASSSNVARVGAFGAPAPATELAATPVGAGSVRLTWRDASEDETGFEIEYREANPGAWRKFEREAAADAETIVVTGLAPETLYEFRVIAKSAAGLSTPSPASEAATEGRVTPPPPPGPPLPPLPPPNRAPAFDPATPLLLTVVEGSTGAIGLVAAHDPDGDDISYRLSGAGRRFAIDADTGEISVRRGVTLDASARSSYAFTAVASDGELSASRDVTVEVVEPDPPGSDPVEQAPAAPSGLQATLLTSSVVVLTWADVADDETGYQVFRREGVGGWEQARTLPAEAEMATVEELSAGIEYEFVVVAANRHGRAASNVAAVELSLAPPTHLDAAPLEETSVRVSWRDNSISETGFEVQIRPRARGDDPDDEADGTRASSGTGTDGEGGAANGWTAAATLGPNSTSAVLDGLEPGGRYLFRVGALGPGAPAFGRTGAFAVASAPAPGEMTDCEPGETAAVLSGGYEVRMCFEMPSGARVDASNYHLESTASGLLYFFDRDNVEVLVKVLDGCAINGHRWVFAAPVTDLAFNLEITEQATGRAFTHRNPRGMTAATAGDAAAFPCDPATAAAASAAEPGGAPPELPGPAAGQPVLTAAQLDDGNPDKPPVCEPEGPGIELEAGHRIDMCFQTPDGEIGRARDWGLRSRSSALLHFFDRENAEVLVKVLDGCNVNGHHWVFAAAATDLAFQLVVTAPDGQRWMHRNSDGDTAKPRADAAAFRCLQ